MSSQGFRFIHASDFRLESPIDGLMELPERFGDAILDAPRLAVKRLFDAAIKEKADFVLLSGDLLSPRDVGAWGLCFLIEQFERLASEHIRVYWATGKSDSPDVVPSAFRFPDSVHIFPVGRVEEVFFSRDSVPIVRILGTSQGKVGVVPRGGVEPVEGADDLYTIGVYNGRLPGDSLKDASIRYWALGGSRERETVSRSPSLAVYAGSTLARNFDEPGDFGATLVEVGESGRTTASLIRTSPVRWFVETISVREDESEEEVIADARAKAKAIQEKAFQEATYAGRAPDDDLCLVRFRAVGDYSVIPSLRYESTVQAILRDLRADFAKASPPLYVVDFEPVLPEHAPEETYERQTILGDYLRMTRYYWENPAERIDVEAFMPDDLRQLRELARAKRDLETKRRLEGESADLDELAARVEVLQAREFEPEVRILREVVELDSANEQGDGDVDPVRAEVYEARRNAALLEATALGVELLADADSPVALLTDGSSLKNAQKKNRFVAAELRALQKNIDGKEIDS